MTSMCHKPQRRTGKCLRPAFASRAYTGDQAKQCGLMGRQWWPPGRRSNLLRARKATRVSRVRGSTDCHGSAFRAATSAAVQSRAHRAPAPLSHDAGAARVPAESCSAAGPSDVDRTCVTVWIKVRVRLRTGFDVRYESSVGVCASHTWVTVVAPEWAGVAAVAMTVFGAAGLTWPGDAGGAVAVDVGARPVPTLALRSTAARSWRPLAACS